MISLDYQNALNKTSDCFVPMEKDVLIWLKIITTELKEKKAVELTVRIVENEEIQQLNADYRQKNRPTNVLSFPFEKPPGGSLEGAFDYLGDIIICAEVVNNEAAQQNKSLDAHWRHMLVHGCLHLYGYDHIDEEEADEMESLEISILKKMGVTSPYE